MKTKERIKNILIIVLVCGAVYLSFSTWYYDSPASDVNFWDLITNPNAYHTGLEPNDETIGNNLTSSIRPLAAAIKTTAGRFGVPYGYDTVNAIYEKTSLLIAEALGSASAPSVASETDWLDALRGNGVFYDYRGAIPVDTLSLWLDTGRTTSFNESARYVFLSISDNSKKARLLLKNPFNERILSFNTELNVSDVTKQLTGISDNSCRFAFELANNFSKVSPEMLIVPNPAKPPVLNGFNPIPVIPQDTLQQLFKSFGINQYAVSKYNEQDGTQVFIEDIITLRLAQNGVITFTDARKTGGTQLGVNVQSARDIPTETEYIETARKLTDKLFGLTHGVGHVYLMDFQYFKDTDDYAALFGQSVDGVSIDMPSTNYLSRVVFHGKNVTSVSFNMRFYTSTGSGASILPEKLAIAAMMGNRQSGDLNLRYADSGSYPLSPGWFIRSNTQKS